MLLSRLRNRYGVQRDNAGGSEGVWERKISLRGKRLVDSGSPVVEAYVCLFSSRLAFRQEQWYGMIYSLLCPFRLVGEGLCGIPLGRTGLWGEQARTKEESSIFFE